MSNLQSKVLSACAWFFGVSFVFAGFGILLSGGGWFSGLLIIVGSCLLLPPIKRLILDQKPNLSRGKTTASGSLLILMGILAFQITKEFSVADAQSLDNVADAQSLDNVADKESVVLEADSYIEANSNSLGVLTAKSKNGYYNISKKNSTSDEFFQKAYLKLGADSFNTDFFLYTHNIEGIRTGDAFKQKTALENIEKYRNETRAYDTPIKIAVNLLPFKTSYGDDAYFDLGFDYTIDSEGLVLSSYDFDKKGFSYTTGNLAACPVSDSIKLPHLDAPNFFYTPFFGLVLELGVANPMEQDCFMHVPDQYIAQRIESARSKDKIAFTGTNYYTLAIEKDENPDISNRSNRKFIGVLDAQEMYLHIIQEDESLSESLASDYFSSGNKT